MRTLIVTSGDENFAKHAKIVKDKKVFLAPFAGFAVRMYGSKAVKRKMSDEPKSSRIRIFHLCGFFSKEVHHEVKTQPAESVNGRFQIRGR